MKTLKEQILEKSKELNILSLKKKLIDDEEKHKDLMAKTKAEIKELEK